MELNREGLERDATTVDHFLLYICLASITYCLLMGPSNSYYILLLLRSSSSYPRFPVSFALSSFVFSAFGFIFFHLVFLWLFFCFPVVGGCPSVCFVHSYGCASFRLSLPCMFGSIWSLLWRKKTRSISHSLTF